MSERAREREKSERWGKGADRAQAHHCRQHRFCPLVRDLCGKGVERERKRERGGEGAIEREKERESARERARKRECERESSECRALVREEGRVAANEGERIIVASFVSGCSCVICVERASREREREIERECVCVCV